MKLYYAQVFWIYGFNTFGYFTKKELKDKRIEHFTIINKKFNK